MCILTVSRGSFSGAKAIAEEVAARLDVPCISREVLAEAARHAGVSADSLTEVLDRPPSFFERLSREREAYMRFVKSALHQRAAAGGFVYHGHGGHYMLSDIPHVLRLRVVAPMKHRIEAVQEQFGMDRRKARRHIAKIDRRRAKWVKLLYGVVWTDPQLYDLVINLDRVDVDSAVEVVVSLSRSPRFEVTEAQQRQFADLALFHSVKAELTKIPEATTAGLRIKAEGGSVLLRGTTQYDELRRSIVEVVKNAPGVDEVHSEINLRSDVFRH